MDLTGDTNARPVADPSPLAALLRAIGDAIADGARPPASIDLLSTEPTLQFHDRQSGVDAWVDWVALCHAEPDEPEYFPAKRTWFLGKKTLDAFTAQRWHGALAGQLILIMTYRQGDAR
jgi:hypothetical protein